MTFENNQVPPGMDGSFLENELSAWESIQAGTLTSLIQKRTLDAISPDEFWELVRFAIWLHLCNPANRAMLRKAWKDLHLEKLKCLSNNDLDEIALKHFGILLPHEYLREKLEHCAAGETLLQSEFLGMVLKSAESIFNLVKEEYSWSLADFKSIDAGLCTSDRPVILGGSELQSKVGFGTPDVTLFFPLSPDLCLKGRNMGRTKKFIQPQNVITNSELVVAPKLLMWAKASQFIIAAERSALPPLGAELPSYNPTVTSGNGFTVMVQR